jgi:hypothetical protein
MLRKNKRNKTAKLFQTKIHICSVVRQQHIKYRSFLQLLFTCVWRRNHYWTHTGPISYTNYATRVGMSRDQFLAILTISMWLIISRHTIIWNSLLIKLHNEFKTLLRDKTNETHIPRHQRDYVPLYEVNSNMNSVIEFLDIIHWSSFNFKTTFLRLDSIIR